jgi:transposase
MGHGDASRKRRFLRTVVGPQANGVSPKEVARNLGVSIPRLYRWLPASERY